MLGECKCCEALKNENIHLRSLVERLMSLIVGPGTKGEGEGKIITDQFDKDKIKFGEG